MDRKERRDQASGTALEMRDHVASLRPVVVRDAVCNPVGIIDRYDSRIEQFLLKERILLIEGFSTKNFNSAASKRVDKVFSSCDTFLCRRKQIDLHKPLGDIFLTLVCSQVLTKVIL